MWSRPGDLSSRRVAPYNPATPPAFANRFKDARMILVTGAAGFIGSNIVAHLTAQGRAVVACDWLGSGDKWRNLAKHPVRGLLAPEDVTDWLAARAGRIEAVIHMGAVSATTETDVDLIAERNFRASARLWDWCARQGARFIYASSAATYGDGANGFSDSEDLDHLDGLRPLNPYGWSKALFDLNAVRRAREDDAPAQWAGLKFFNVYGPNEYHKAGQRSVVHQLFEQIRDTGRARLFRSHHPDYADGGQMRDFVWVGDCVAMVDWLLANPGVSGLFNCGTGTARSFRDLALATFAALGRDPEIDYVPTPEALRRHYQYFTQADMAKARRAGFGHNATSLESGVERYVRDHLSRDDPYR